jgi:hypothetical protein
MKDMRQGPEYTMRGAYWHDGKLVIPIPPELHDLFEFSTIVIWREGKTSKITVIPIDTV